ncbi:hypothetical protein ONS96_002298 [Cadophora gregata f. sp. sojae]|nr:hypothetical protein ONS96_002298 [Cadophora gregata f. sp. sojae]
MNTNTNLASRTISPSTPPTERRTYNSVQLSVLTEASRPSATSPPTPKRRSSPALGSNPDLLGGICSAQTTTTSTAAAAERPETTKAERGQASSRA